MRNKFGKSWWIINAVLIVLLTSAQTGAIAHAYEHESGTFQDAACASCATASQLCAACIDNGGEQDVQPSRTCLEMYKYVSSESICPLTARQRGPPLSL